MPVATGLLRRRFLTLLGSGLLVPFTTLADELDANLEPTPEADRRSPEFVHRDVDPAKLWDGKRQLVLAYQQGETLGEPCRQLDAVREELPVKLVWRPPPDWVRVFPTIHFEVSNRHWIKFEEWKDVPHFVRFYGQYNPPPKSRDAISPFKDFAAEYEGPHWSFPGRITDHLLDPTGPHQFSEYELQGLTVREKKRLHSAHHAGDVEPGRKATKPIASLPPASPA